MLLNSILLQTEPGGPGSGLMQILMIVALIAIFYFFMIRPQNKKQKEKKILFFSGKRRSSGKPGEYKSTGSATDTGICGTELRKIVSK